MKPILFKYLLLLGLWVFLQSPELFSQCSQDTIAPVCIPPTAKQITCKIAIEEGIDWSDTLVLQERFGEAMAIDSCVAWTKEEFIAKAIDPTCGTGTVTRYFRAYDENGNVSPTRSQLITIQPSPDFTINLPADYNYTDSIYEEANATGVGCEGLQVFYRPVEDVAYDLDCDGATDEIHRIWYIHNRCHEGYQLSTLPRLDTDGDSITGDAYTVQSDGIQVYLLENGVPVSTLGSSTTWYEYIQVLRLNEADTLSANNIEGRVFIDSDQDCIDGAAEVGLADWIVEIEGEITGQIYQTTTNPSGQYDLEICRGDTAFTVRLYVPFDYGGNCSSSYSFHVAPGTSNIQVDFPVALEANCPLLYVDITTPFLRRCFTNQYRVHYCNYSAQSVPNAFIDIRLDEFMNYQDASIPGLLIQDSIWRFELDTLAPGMCGSFDISFNLSCDAVWGQSHCTEAHIYPDSLCGPSDPNWSGASLEVDGYCEGDSVYLNIINVGADMLMESQYIVVEDVLMFQTDSIQLSAGESHPISLPANGATWHLSVDQVVGHPGMSMPSISMEGCGGLNFPGLVMAHAQDDANTFISIDCQQNIGSFDPNDKQAFPSGLGDEHIILANTDIEYIIRFQNTGTDTAFNVSIIDTLSPFVDVESIRPGASSHPYGFEKLANQVIRFNFNHILLPDSNTNEAASHGFVKFRVAQQLDNPLGTVIYNDAAIYFDFNEPIITNTTFLTIGRYRLPQKILSTKDLDTGSIQISPNPFQSSTLIKWDGSYLDQAVIQIYQPNGQLISQESFSGQQYIFQRGDLAKGLYFFQIQSDLQIIGNGKLMVH
ncbi:MAG: T9SS type A sorting domain-containing protein [Bacteroidota bacterium]